MMSMIKAYEKYGYVLLPQMLHSTLVYNLNSELKTMKANMIKSDRTDMYNQRFHMDNCDNIRKIKRPHEWSNTFKQLVYNPFITNIVSKLLNNPESCTRDSQRFPNCNNIGIRYQGFKLNIKPPYDGINSNSTFFHQDFAYYPHCNDYLCTVCIPLTDLTIEKGTLVYVAGSHTKPIYSHHINGEFTGAIPLSVLVAMDSHNIEDKNSNSNSGGIEKSKTMMDIIECKAGSIIVHNSRTVHGSFINETNEERALLLIQYGANDCWPLMQSYKGAWGYQMINCDKPDHGPNEWDLYQSTIITGNPCYHPYIKHIPNASLSLPWPSRNTYGSIYNQQNQLNTNNLKDNKDNGIDINSLDALRYDYLKNISSIGFNIVSNMNDDPHVNTSTNIINVEFSPPAIPTPISNRQITSVFDFTHDKLGNDESTVKVESKESFGYLWDALVEFVSIGEFGVLRPSEMKDYKNKLGNTFVNACKLYPNNDEMIYQQCYNCYHNEIKPLLNVSNTNKQEINYNKRVSMRSNEIIQILEKIDTTLAKVGGIKNVLDVGCGDGKIAAAIGKYYRLDKENIHGIDVTKRLELNENDITFTYASDLSNKFDSKPETIDLVICLMSMHHIEHQTLLLQNIYRIMKKGGILIIRDHDCFIPEYHIILDILHGFHCKVWSNKNHPNFKSDFNSSFKSYYQSYPQWNMTFHSIGFKKHSLTPIKSETFDIKNVFFGIYTK